MFWPVPNVWVFKAQLVEHCSANTEAVGSNPVEALKTFLGLTTAMITSSFHLYICSSHNIHMFSHIIVYQSFYEALLTFSYFLPRGV